MLNLELELNIYILFHEQYLQLQYNNTIFIINFLMPDAAKNTQKTSVFITKKKQYFQQTR